MAKYKKRGAPKRITIDDDTREQVAMCAGFGLTWPQISHVVGISERTLQRECKKDFERGCSVIVNNVAKTLYQTAIDRNDKNHVTAAIFFLKTRARWRENSDLNDAKPLPPIKIEIEQKPCS